MSLVLCSGLFFLGGGGGKGPGIGLGIPLALHSGSTSDGLGGTIMGCRGLNPGQHRTRKKTLPTVLCYSVTFSKSFVPLTYMVIYFLDFVSTMH